MRDLLPSDTRECLALWLAAVTAGTAKQYRNKSSTLRRCVGVDDPVDWSELVGVTVAMKEAALERSGLYGSALAWMIAKTVVAAPTYDALEQALAAYLLVDAARDADVEPAYTRMRDEYPKRFRQQDRDRVLSWLQNCRRQEAMLLSALLVVIEWMGARPNETRDIQHAYEHGDGADTLVVTIRNSKWTPDGTRGCGPTRTLRFREFDAELREALDFIVQETHGVSPSVWSERLEFCQRLLRDACWACFSVRARSEVDRSNAKNGRVLRPDRRYRLYSMRHQFAANSKKAMRDAETPKNEAVIILAALMGHADDATADEHYAKARFGRAGAYLPDPDEKNLVAVRRTREVRLEAVANRFATKTNPSGPRGP